MSTAESTQETTSKKKKLKVLKVENNDLNMMEAPDEGEISNNPLVWSMSEAVNLYSFADDR